MRCVTPPDSERSKVAPTEVHLVAVVEPNPIQHVVAGVAGCSTRIITEDINDDPEAFVVHVEIGVVAVGDVYPYLIACLKLIHFWGCLRSEVLSLVLSDG